MWLIIRVDANTNIGTGHLMRCIALAQAWQDEGGNALFVTACDNEQLNQRLVSERMDIEKISTVHPDGDDWKLTKTVIEKYPESWVVLDGYQFDAEYQKKIKSLGNKLLVIDDMAHLDYYHADIILNQNIDAEKKNYNHNPGVTLLLGTDYALLRREFWKWRAWKRDIPEVAKKILVTLGGGDLGNVTLKVLQALELVEIAGIEVAVVVGAANPHLERIKEFASQSKHKVRLEYTLINMPKLMVWADLAISAGGSTCWELAFMGLPAIVNVIAKNQTSFINKNERNNAFIVFDNNIDFGNSKLANLIDNIVVDVNMRQKLCEKGQQLVDGYGAKSVVDTIINSSIYLRSVCADDSYRVWEWANDPITRFYSFNSGPISYEDHKRWFAAKIADPNSVILIALNLYQIPVGLVRFSIDKNVATVSIVVGPDYRGKGLSTQILSLSTKWLFENVEVSEVKAHIKQDNKASRKAFTKAGFSEENYLKYEGQDSFYYVKRRQ